MVHRYVPQQWMHDVRPTGRASGRAGQQQGRAGQGADRVDRTLAEGEKDVRVVRGRRERIASGSARASYNIPHRVIPLLLFPLSPAAVGTLSSSNHGPLLHIGEHLRLFWNTSGNTFMAYLRRFRAIVGTVVGTPALHLTKSVE